MLSVKTPCSLKINWLFKLDEPIKPDPWACKVCGFYFNTNQELESHMHQMHQNTVEDHHSLSNTIPATNLKFNSILYKQAEPRKPLKSWVYIDIWMCHICGMAFITKQEVENHMHQMHQNTEEEMP